MHFLPLSQTLNRMQTIFFAWFGRWSLREYAFTSLWPITILKMVGSIYWKWPRRRIDKHGTQHKKQARQLNSNEPLCGNWQRARTACSSVAPTVIDDVCERSTANTNCRIASTIFAIYIDGERAASWHSQRIESIDMFTHALDAYWFVFYCVKNTVCAFTI